jgi:hypothetical protein
MFALAVANVLVVALAWLEICTEEFWAIYALTGPTVAQAALLVVFYFSFRKQIAERMAERVSASQTA